MALTNNPYATVEQVKAALDLQGTDKDTLLTELIGEAQDLIDALIGYRHQTTTVAATYQYDGNDAEQLWIDDIVSMTSVTQVVRDALTGSITDTVDLTTLVCLGPANTSPQYILEFFQEGREFPRGKRNIEVTGVFGNPTIDPRLTRATIRLVTQYWGMMSTYYTDMIADQGGLRQHYSKKLPDDVERIIGSFHQTLFLSREK